MKITNSARNRPPKIRIDFLFPKLTKNGKAIDLQEIDKEIQKMVMERGGATISGTVQGKWINQQGQQVNEELVSFYVITPDLPAITNEYLPRLRERLEAQYKQDEVLITYHSDLIDLTRTL